MSYVMIVLMFCSQKIKKFASVLSAENFLKNNK